MIYPNRFSQRQRPQTEDCAIEIKQSKHGKKIKISGRCSASQLEYAKKATGINEVEENNGN